MQCTMQNVSQTKLYRFALEKFTMANKLHLVDQILAALRSL